MKPNFALTLSFEGIGLLHRAFPGWHLVGEISLDNPDLLQGLKALRDKAVALDPSGLRSKLVIPNDQVRYIQFARPTDASDDIPALVEKNLDGATPYALSDLAYDWEEQDGMVSVAAVARETLREAEAFAKEHSFNPISFVAIPEGSDFVREPFFGETAYAAEIAEDGAAVERDPVPVRIIGSAKMSDTLAELTQTEPEEAEDVPVSPFVSTRRADEAASPETSDTVADFAEPAAVFEPQGEPDETTTAQEDAPEEPTDSTSFTSIRAQRGEASSAAPKLDGVARNFTPAPVSAAVVADSLPNDPDLEAERLAAAEPVTEDLPEAEHARIPPAPTEPIAIAPPDHAGFSSPRVTAVAAAARSGYGIPSLEEQERMTVFGARGAEPIGGKPRYLGLILTAVLLLFLAGVATWAAIFLDDGLSGFFGDDPEIIIADVPAIPDTSASPDITDDDVEGTLREALTQPKPLQLTEDEARARYAATGIWLVAPQMPPAPASGNLDEFYQASIDSSIEFQDAIALPDVDDLLADTRPQTPSSPAQAGTVFALDQRGLVVATPEGALSPDGIIIYAGQPPVRPQAMPKRELVADVVKPDEAEVLRLAAFKPKVRPIDLSEQNERNNLSGRTLDELASFRPRLRPQSAQETAETAVNPFIDLDAVNSAVTEAVETDLAFVSPTAQAVASSLKPNTRPRNFDAIVNRSTASQQTTVAVSAAQKIAPRIPTATSVAKQATQRNVLRMRDINLIGVYGAPSSRRALVRLPNGRYRKVKVGDRLDGGKVSAIGDHELRYLKRGRNVVLEMPKG